MSSAARVGRKAQCQPRSRISDTATPRSSSVSSGDSAPSANNGKATISSAAGAMAMSHAERWREDLSDFKTSEIHITAQEQDIRIDAGHESPRNSKRTLFLAGRLKF